MKKTDPFYLSKAWRAIREKALIRDGYECVWCHVSVRGKGLSRVDHVRPRKECRELELTLSNLRTLCVGCDAKRHRDKARGAVARQQVDDDGYPESWG